jgi:RecJ-like exonuclease
VGGGHNVAAGATIPLQAKQEFLEMMDRIVAEQLSYKNNIGRILSVNTHAQGREP